MRTPEFSTHLRWFNTKKPLTLKELRGHVILLNFWTYSGIHCIHVLKDLEFLVDKYKRRPFLVVGIHSPKFDNEKVYDNLQSALDRLGIAWPVAADNDHMVWDQFGIHAWPSYVLIDAEGGIIGEISGEGNREILDKVISDALNAGRKGKKLALKRVRAEKRKIPDTVLRYPSKIAVDESRGEMFVSDTGHRRILRLKLEEKNRARVIDTAGNGKAGKRDGIFEEAVFEEPRGLAVNGNYLYACDAGRHEIRKLDLKNRVVSTVAGNGRQNRVFRLNVPLNVQSLNSPWDCVLFENFLYVAMAGSHQIWRMGTGGGQMEIYAGNGLENLTDGHLANSQLAQPAGIAVGGTNIYFTDSESSSVRVIDTIRGLVSTLAGKGLFYFGNIDGNYDEALFQHPTGICHADGILLVSDTFNHSVREIDLKKKTCRTLIGKTDNGDCLVGGKPAPVPALNEPDGLAAGGDKVYIVDTNRHAIRVYDRTRNSLDELEILA